LKILIIEDNEQEIELIEHYCLEESKTDIEIDSATTGTKGLELFSKNDYRVVILDYQLPDFDGFELLKNMLNQRIVPVILVTAAGSEEAAVKAIKLGAFDYIPKTGSHYTSIISILDRIASFPVFELDRCPISVFAADERGPNIIYSDNLPWGEKSEIVQLKAGIFFTAAIAQGMSYHEGIFGPLPVAEVDDYFAVIYSKVMKAKEAIDPRRKNATFTIFCIYYPSEYQTFFLDRFRLNKIFEDALRDIQDIAEVSGIISNLKKNISSNLGEFNPVFYRFL